MSKIPRHVLTGGPCSGKTSGLAMLVERLPEYGVTPFVVPELATLVFSSGIKIDDIRFDPDRLYEFQKRMVSTQLALEDAWVGFAELQPGDKKVLICDRGAKDSEAYLPDGVFKKVLADLGLGELDLLDKRYEAVYHMVTAADGAEDFYSFNNPARYETPEEARDRDRKTLEAWTGHEHLRIIGNSEVVSGAKRQIDFSKKLELLLKAVCLSLGVPAPYEIERKFLVALDTDPAFFPVSHHFADITQTYLQKLERGVSRRIRERTCGGTSLYVYTEKRNIRSGVREETERLIDVREYSTFLREGDPRRLPVLKRRYSFAWEHQYFQLDRLNSPESLVLLEVELTDERQEVLLPPFVKVIKEVTDEPRYTNSAIAAGRCPGYV